MTITKKLKPDDKTIRAEQLTKDELLELQSICCEPNCYRESAKGYISCLQCLHGTSCRASDDLIALKKRWKATQKTTN